MTPEHKRRAKDQLAESRRRDEGSFCSDSISGDMEKQGGWLTSIRSARSNSSGSEKRSAARGASVMANLNSPCG